MGSPENDTITIIAKPSYDRESIEIKRERQVYTFLFLLLRFSSPFSPCLFLSIMRIIRHIIFARARVYIEDHMAFAARRGATNRILRRWRRSKTKPNKARREEERTKGSLSFTETARPHRAAHTTTTTSAHDARVQVVLFLFLRAYACSLPLARYEPRDRVSLAAGTFSRFFSAAR